MNKVLEQTVTTRFSVPGPALVWVSNIIFAASNSVVQLLTELGAMNPVEGRNAISFCNLLFVGNLCACVTLIAIFRKSWTRENLAALSAVDWSRLVVLSVLSGAIAPALIFLALEKTTVTNVLLMGRIEPPLELLLCAILLKAKVDRWAVAGTVITVLGAVTIYVLQYRADPMALGMGELQAALAAVTWVAAAMLGKRFLGRVPLGIFTVTRTAIGTVVFFSFAIYLFGADHFQDAFSPFLWKWMLVYGAIIVVVGQLCWFGGIATTSVSQITLANSFTPIAGVVFAVLLVGEKPSMAVLIGGGIIVLGIVIAQLGPMVERRAQARRAPTADEVVTLEGGVNFKGV